MSFFVLSIFGGWVRPKYGYIHIFCFFLLNPKKKNKFGKIQKGARPPPPPVMEKIFLFFFLKLGHFLRTFCKKCIFTIENSKKLLLNKQIFASSDAKFCHDARNNGR